MTERVEIKIYKGSTLLDHVWVRTEGALAAEVGACERRIAKGEASHFEVIKFGSTETHYS